MRAYVGVGSNLGDRWAHLAWAAQELRRAPGVCLLQTSHVYDTAPMGPAQPRYLNAVIELDCGIAPQRLLDVLHAIEQSAGRRRGVQWGPRTLDLDLLLYEHLVLRTAALTLPHPGIRSRRFVLAPLADLCPDRIVPGTGCTVAALLRAAPVHDMSDAGLFPG